MAQLQRLMVTAQQVGDRKVAIGLSLPLTQEQQHYLIRVLRLVSGDRFFAILPDRTTWLAQIGPDSTDSTDLTLSFELLELQEVTSELPIDITLVLSLPKGSGFDDVVRQVTELGVTRIIPVISDRTVLKPSANRHERWQKIAMEAAEQSERSRSPEVCEPIKFSDYLKSVATPEQNRFYFCWGRGDSVHLLTQVQQDLRADRMAGEITIAIGPEGGWTDSEVEKARQSGFVTVSLGKRILRAITAPSAAMAIVAAAIERSEWRRLGELSDQSISSPKP